jgi:hypothetical protein
MVYLQRLALLDQLEIMFTVDHLFALSNPALMSALSKKIVLQGEPTDLRLHLLDVGSRGSIGLFAKGLAATLQELRFPGRYLVGMNFKLLCNLGNGFVAPKSGNSHLGLED